MSQQSRQRIEALRASMVRAEADLLAIGPGSHMEWLLGFHPHPDERPCLFLMGRNTECFLMPVLNAEGSRQSTDIVFHCWSDDVGPQAALSDALASIGAEAAKSIILDEMMRADFALLVMDALPGARHAFTAPTLGELRMRKDDADYADLKANARIADRAMLAAFGALKPGLTELQVAAVIKDHFASEGATPAFWIVGASANGAFPHHQTGNTVLKTGDAIVIDIGGRKGHFCSDITRMAVIGTPPEDYLKVHSIVEQAVRAALQAARPGVKAKVVDAAARDVITAAGYGDYFVHRTGHGLGIDGHEPPYITSTSETVLDEGMVFSIEPGIYLPGRFGVRLEEIVILRKDGPEIFSELPRDLKRVPA